MTDVRTIRGLVMACLRNTIPLNHPKAMDHHFPFFPQNLLFVRRYTMIPVVPARGGAEVALKIYIYIRPFSSIELACAVRQPSPCVRALCETGILFHMSHLKLHFTLHTWQSSHSTLHTSHFTLHPSQSTLHTSQSTLHTPHFTLHTPHFTLHTPHFTLHSSCPTLHTAPFISSELFSPYPSSSLLISSLLICQQSFHESLPSTTTKELACAVRQPGPCVRALCETGVLFHMSHLKLHFALRTWQSSHSTLHTSHCTLHTPHSSHFTLHLYLGATWRSPANAICKNTQHDTSKVLRLPRKMTMDASKVLRLPRKLPRIFCKRRKSIAPATQNDFRHVTTHVWMSRSAMPATRNEATPHVKPPKMTPPAELTIGMASCGRLRTVASQTQRRATTPSAPRPPEWKRNPCYAFGKNWDVHQPKMAFF